MLYMCGGVLRWFLYLSREAAGGIARADGHVVGELEPAGQRRGPAGLYTPAGGLNQVEEDGATDGGPAGLDDVAELAVRVALG